MATERQIAANRANARKSTGPRSSAGKRRSGKNAIRHGLSVPLSGPEHTQELEALARQIGEAFKDPGAMELARSAAAADLELARVRQLKADLINGTARLLPFTNSSGALMTLPTLLHRIGTGGQNRLGSQDMAEAIRRTLPELEKLERYEIRAVGRRNRAMRALIGSG